MIYLHSKCIWLPLGHSVCPSSARLKEACGRRPLHASFREMRREAVRVQWGRDTETWRALVVLYHFPTPCTVGNMEEMWFPPPLARLPSPSLLSPPSHLQRCGCIHKPATVTTLLSSDLFPVKHRWEKEVRHLLNNPRDHQTIFFFYVSFLPSKHKHKNQLERWSRPRNELVSSSSTCPPLQAPPSNTAYKEICALKPTSKHVVPPFQETFPKSNCS